MISMIGVNVSSTSLKAKAPHVLPRLYCTVLHCVQREICASRMKARFTSNEVSDISLLLVNERKIIGANSGNEIRNFHLLIHQPF